MNAETLKGHLELLLLAAVQTGGPTHGYAIAETLRARSDGAFDLPEGTLYPALHRLERAGLLSSQWSEVNGRRRRVYQLTRAGHRALAKRHDEWRDFARAVHAVVEGPA
jgi:PadR family transcriptional regulator, regulatory protein PadR